MNWRKACAGRYVSGPYRASWHPQHRPPRTIWELTKDLEIVGHYPTLASAKMAASWDSLPKPRPSARLFCRCSGAGCARCRG